MTEDDQQRTDGSNEQTETDRPGISRRSTLALGGTALGSAALVSGSVLAQGDEDETPTPGGGDETPTSGGGDETPTPTGEDGHFLSDLADPVFGYSLASEETNDVDLEHVVDVITESGAGAHENFPQEPDESAPGSVVEIQAEFLFDPVGLHVEPGDLVHFNTVSGFHTVSAFHEKFGEPGFEIPRRVPDGVPGYTSPPLTPGESWVYEFTEKGVYDYFCFPHLGLGMVGRIVVLDPEEDDVESDEFAAPTAGELFPNDERVLDADELTPANIVESGAVAWSDLTLDSLQTPTRTPTETPTEAATETETVADTSNGSS